MKVVILVGPPGCGKSSYADKIVACHEPGKVQILSLDRFRIAIWGSKSNYWAQRDNGKIKQQLSTTYDLALSTAIAFKAFETLVIDNCHISGPNWGGSNTIDKVMVCCTQAGINPDIKVFRLPLAVALQRNDLRPVTDRVPRFVVSDGWDRHESPEAWWRTYKGDVEQVGGISAWAEEGAIADG